MSEEQINPHRIDDDATAPSDVEGTDDGNPVAGLEIDDEQHEEAVVPDDKSFEVDGPATRHA